MRLKAWKVTMVGDDIAWIKPDDTGRLRAINPEAGVFGVAPGTSARTNPNAMATIAAQHDLHERRADARGRRLVGGHDRRAAGRVSRLAGPAVDAGDRARDRRDGGPSQRALHRAGSAVSRSSMRTGRIPAGVPISAFIFGGRRATTMPLVYQAFNWTAGVYTGATMGSETTAAAAGSVGKVRRDPMAMLPFCGYHMGDYFRHWIQMQRALSETPKVFHVNWFRKDADGTLPVAGLPGKHARAEVDRRSCARQNARAKRRRSAGCRALRTSTGAGCRSREEQFEALQAVDPSAWRREVIEQEELFIDLHDHLPPEMVYERELLICRL